MKSAFRIWIPFGELLHHETEVGGPVWRKGSGNPEWWVERARILREFTLPSLRQLVHGSSIWGGIPKESEGIAKPVIAALVDFGGSPVFHPARDSGKYGKGPAREAVRTFMTYRDDEAITFLCIDSDDMYLKSAVECIAQDVSPGLVQLFRKGYVLNAATREMRVYDPKGAPPPFFTKTYTRDYLDDPDGYEERWNFCLPHNRFLESVNQRDLPHGQFVVVAHEANTTSMWDRLEKMGKFGVRLPDEARDDVLRRCGHVG